jgi:hypothetical protein
MPTEISHLYNKTPQNPDTHPGDHVEFVQSQTSPTTSQSTNNPQNHNRTHQNPANFTHQNTLLTHKNMEKIKK